MNCKNCKRRTIGEKEYCATCIYLEKNPPKIQTIIPIPKQEIGLASKRVREKRSPANNEWRKKYRNTPKQKLHHQEYAKEYKRRPEVMKRNNELSKIRRDKLRLELQNLREERKKWIQEKQ